MHNVLGQTLADRYEIQREVGRGGMATVYAATDLQTSGIVAVKVMRSDLVASLGGGRFAREMHITASQLRSMCRSQTRNTRVNSGAQNWG